MRKRLQSLILFSTLALLLSIKLGLNFLPSTTDSVAEQLPTTAPVADIQANQMPASLATPASATALDQDSLAMLEAYLIPAANAEASPAVAGEVIEDETLTSLRKYRDDLDQRSKNLDQRESSLKEAEDQLERRIQELEQLEASIQQRLIDESKVKSKKIKRLTAVYEGMKPERAAPVIEKMELETVVKIFLLMDEKKVGKILSFLPPEKAVTISQALTRQISAVK